MPTVTPRVVRDGCREPCLRRVRPAPEMAAASSAAPPPKKARGADTMTRDENFLGSVVPSTTSDVSVLTLLLLTGSPPTTRDRLECSRRRILPRFSTIVRLCMGLSALELGWGL